MTGGTDAERVTDIITTRGYDRCAIVSVTLPASNAFTANRIITSTTPDFGTVTFNIQSGASGNIDLLSWVLVSHDDAKTTPAISAATTSTVSDGTPPTISGVETLTTTDTTTNQEFKFQVSEPIELSNISVACDSESTTLTIADSTGGSARTSAVQAATDVFVTISGGLDGGQAYTSCVLTVTDGTNTATQPVGGFTFADTTAPTFDSIAVERSSTNADAKSTKYAKQGDTVKVTLNFNENISSVGTVVIKMGGSSGTTVTSVGHSLSDPKDPSDDTTFDGSSDTTSSVYYTFTVPTSATGAVYVSADEFIDKASSANTQSVEQNYTTTTATDTLASFFVIDTTAPSAPAAPDLSEDDDSGHSNSDNNTSVTTPGIAVNVAANERARVTATKGADTVVVTSTTELNQSGVGNLRLGTLGDGTWSVEVEAIDNAGNSTASGSPLSVVVDTAAPTGPTVPLNSAAPFASSDRYINSSENTNNAAIVLVGTTTGTGKHDGSDAFALTSSTAACDSALTFSTDRTTVEVQDVSSDGQYRVCFRAADAAGNHAYVASDTFTRDTADPSALVISLGDGTTYQLAASDASPASGYSRTLSGYASIATSGATCDNSVTFTDPIPSNNQFTVTSGQHPCVKVADAANNVIYTKTVTEGAAVAGIEVGSVQAPGSKLVNSRTFSLYGTGPTGAVVTLRRRSTSTTTDLLTDYATVIGTHTIAAGSTNWSVDVTVPADDTYDFATTAVLSGGTALNTPVPYKGVVVDTVPPTVALTSPAPTNVSNATTATATVGGTDVTHYKHEIVAGASCSGVTYDGSEVAVGTAISDATAITPLADGPVSLCVIGRDQAGNWQRTGTRHGWTKDTTGPTLSFVSLTSDNAGNGAFSKENNVLTAVVRVSDTNPATTFTPTASITVGALSLIAASAVRLTNGNIQIVATLPASLGTTVTLTPSVSVIGSTVVDATGNAATDLTVTSTNHTVDNQSPTLASVSTTTNKRKRTSITLTSGAAIADEPLKIVLTGECSSFSEETVTGVGTETVEYTRLRSGDYDDCTIQLVDPVGHTSGTAVAIPSFTVLSGGGGVGLGAGAGLRAPSLPTAQPVQPLPPTVSELARPQQIAYVRQQISNVRRRLAGVLRRRIQEVQQRIRDLIRTRSAQ